MTSTKEQKGVIDPISIIAGLFLVVTLIVGTVVVNDRGFSLNIAEKASTTGNSCFDECRKDKGRVYCNNLCGININWQGEQVNTSTNTSTTGGVTCDANGTQYNVGEVVLYGGITSLATCGSDGRWIIGQGSLSDVKDENVPTYAQDAHQQAVTEAQPSSDEGSKPEPSLTQPEVDKICNVSIIESFCGNGTNNCTNGFICHLRKAVDCSQKIEQTTTTCTISNTGQTVVDTKECNSGSKECDGSTLKTCSQNGFWVRQNCQYGCANSACKANTPATIIKPEEITEFSQPNTAANTTNPDDLLQQIPGYNNYQGVGSGYQTSTQTTDQNNLFAGFFNNISDKFNSSLSDSNLYGFGSYGLGGGNAYVAPVPMNIITSNDRNAIDNYISGNRTSFGAGFATATSIATAPLAYQYAPQAINAVMNIKYIPQILTAADALDSTTTGIACNLGNQEACSYFQASLFIPGFASPNMLVDTFDDFAQAWSGVGTTINRNADNIIEAIIPSNYYNNISIGNTETAISTTSDMLFAPNYINPLVDVASTYSPGFQIGQVDNIKPFQPLIDTPKHTVDTNSVFADNPLISPLVNGPVEAVNFYPHVLNNGQGSLPQYVPLEPNPFFDQTGQTLADLTNSFYNVTGISPSFGIIDTQPNRFGPQVFNANGINMPEATTINIPRPIADAFENYIYSQTDGFLPVVKNWWDDTPLNLKKQSGNNTPKKTVKFSENESTDKLVKYIVGDEITNVKDLALKIQTDQLDLEASFGFLPASERINDPHKYLNTLLEIADREDIQIVVNPTDMIIRYDDGIIYTNRLDPNQDNDLIKLAHELTHAIDDKYYKGQFEIWELEYRAYITGLGDAVAVEKALGDNFVDFLFGGFGVKGSVEKYYKDIGVKDMPWLNNNISIPDKNVPFIQRFQDWFDDKFGGIGGSGSPSTSPLADDVIDDLNTSGLKLTEESLNIPNIAEGFNARSYVFKKTGFTDIVTDPSTGLVHDSYEILLDRVKARVKLGETPLEAINNILLEAKNLGNDAVDLDEVSLLFFDKNSMSSKVLCYNPLDCLETPILQQALLADTEWAFGDEVSDTAVIIGFGGTRGKEDYPFKHGALVVGDQIVGYNLIPRSQEVFQRYANIMKWGNFFLLPTGAQKFLTLFNNLKN